MLGGGGLADAVQLRGTAQTTQMRDIPEQLALFEQHLSSIISPDDNVKYANFVCVIVIFLLILKNYRVRSVGISLPQRPAFLPDQLCLGALP